MADTQTPAQGEGEPTAGAQELQVPKYRFDEEVAKRRRLEQESEMQKQLLTQLAAQNRQPAQPQGPSAEDLGMDPQLFGQVRTLMQREFTQERKQMENFIGALQTEIEVTKFVAGKPERAAYLQKVQELQQYHAQTTRTYLPVEMAYKMIRADELEQREARAAQPRPAAPAGQPAPQPPAGYTPPSYPNPRGTQGTIPGAPAAGVAPSVDPTLEELEARLEEQFGQGYTA